MKGAHRDSTLSRLAVKMILLTMYCFTFLFVQVFSEMLKLNDSGETFIALMIMQFRVVMSLKPSSSFSADFLTRRMCSSFFFLLSSLMFNWPGER